MQQDPLFMMHSGNLRTILGHCDGELLHRADRVIVSPGVPLDNYGLSSLLHSVSIHLIFLGNRRKQCYFMQHSNVMTDTNPFGKWKFALLLTDAFGECQTL